MNLRNYGPQVNQVCGRNKTWGKIGYCLNVGGIIMVAVGTFMSWISLDVFKPRMDYEDAIDLVDSLLD